MKTLDQKRDVILGIMNTPNEKMTVEMLSEAVREIVDIMWPMPDVPQGDAQIHQPTIDEKIMALEEKMHAVQDKLEIPYEDIAPAIAAEEVKTQ